MSVQASGVLHALTLGLQFAAVLVYSPVFMVPGIAVAGFGAWLGQLYIRAQLAVKREMSNARSPVLAHFGAAIAGIGARDLCTPGKNID